MNWKVTDIKSQLNELLDSGDISDRIPLLLIKEGFCAPIECEILDYKENFEEDDKSYAKLIKKIASFYNSYGGYLIYGVTEVESETVFAVTSKQHTAPNIEKVKALCKSYLDERIAVTMAQHTCKNTSDQESTVSVLHIPRRTSQLPVAFIKDGPKDTFTKKQIYHRSRDECIEAKGHEIFDLAGERPSPFRINGTPFRYGILATRRIQTKLPDKNIICPNFIGRADPLNQLWNWLGDDLSSIKLLTGEGGLGKSSLAYEFAVQTSKLIKSPFEQIVWLTAKQRQFDGSKDSYTDLANADFASYRELLESIAENLPEPLTTPLKEISDRDLKRIIKSGLTQYPSLFILDDIDSLTTEEQKQASEIGLMLGAMQSKILLTNRHDQTYSPDTTIRLHGFSSPTTGDEYAQYVDSLFLRGILRKELSSKQLRELHSTTEGSPLYTESLCRLFRFSSFEEALNRWKKEGGEGARRAALDREIQQLSPEAKRILLAAALVGRASVPNLSEITECSLEKVEQAIQELSTLHLVSGDPIGDTPNFIVPSNTIRLVKNSAQLLATDHKKIELRIKDLSQPLKHGKGRDDVSRLAITQAQAQVRQHKHMDAIATLTDAIKLRPKNGDLKGVKAELFMQIQPPRHEEARRLARDAIQIGCNRPTTFDTWFDAEMQSGHYPGAIEAAEMALTREIGHNHEWLMKNAAALFTKATNSGIGTSPADKLSTLIRASELIHEAVKTTRGETSTKYQNVRFDVHDQIWSVIIDDGLTRLDEIRIARGQLEKFWRTQDVRLTNASRCIEVVNALIKIAKSSVTNERENRIDLYTEEFKLCEKLIDARLTEYPQDTRHPQLIERWEKAKNKFHDTLTTSGQ
ncbi:MULTISPECIES: RNA-binding domain-containing protein [Derxia]|uniref:RNA-binding domain-containing protein n=1 Tax=Derxia gummosa DSM 723 TaxID=1121388 RepID=A0A8B6XC59_9BURK|nr:MULTISPECIES: RNA-binding domain-containing protein [Derxia]